MNITKNIIEHVFLSCGFDIVGITQPDIEYNHKRALVEWIKSGQNGTMDWMERNIEKRTDPRTLEKWVKSIVVVAKNYYPGRAEEHKNGKISNYAWGQDYHKFIRKQIKIAIKRLKKEQPGIKARGLVDTAPVMEKSLAQKAGLGWIAKNTMLITRELGSWVFLGTVFLDIPIEPQAREVNNHCGSCVACIEACPVDALTPYILDARKCISYQTIEKKGNIDINLHGWSFGCDICQEVCPWNHFEKITNDKYFAPGSQKVFKKSYNEKYFIREFKESAVSRAGYVKVNQSIKNNRKNS